MPRINFENIFIDLIRSQAQANLPKDKDKVDAAPVTAQANEHRLEKQNSTEESAIIIQKIWRGYNTRKMNKCIADTLHRNRTQQHIE